MRAMPGMPMLLGQVETTLVLAWDSGDRQLNNKKMALLRVPIDGAQHRARESSDWHTHSMLISIGTYVTRS